MKNSIAGLSLLLGLLASGASIADERSTCQPGCAEDKRECSALAQHSAKLENSPLAKMNDKLPHIAGSSDARGRSIGMRAEERREFEDRKMARVRACDDKYMKCVRACSATEPEAGSVVLRRKGEL
jgi:hypothetical protein